MLLETISSTLDYSRSDIFQRPKELLSFTPAGLPADYTSFVSSSHRDDDFISPVSSYITPSLTPSFRPSSDPSNIPSHRPSPLPLSYTPISHSPSTLTPSRQPSLSDKERLDIILVAHDYEGCFHGCPHYPDKADFLYNPLAVQFFLHSLYRLPCNTNSSVVLLPNSSPPSCASNCSALDWCFFGASYLRHCNQSSLNWLPPNAAIDNETLSCNQASIDRSLDEEKLLADALRSEMESNFPIKGIVYKKLFIATLQCVVYLVLILGLMCCLLIITLTYVVIKRRSAPAISKPYQKLPNITFRDMEFEEERLGGFQH